jgi:hypothetical protein
MMVITLACSDGLLCASFILIRFIVRPKMSNNLPFEIYHRHPRVSEGNPVLIGTFLIYSDALHYINRMNYLCVKQGSTYHLKDNREGIKNESDK